MFIQCEEVYTEDLYEELIDSVIEELLANDETNQFIEEVNKEIVKNLEKMC